MPTAADLAVQTLGHCRIDSPLKPLLEARQTTAHYVAEDDRVFFHDTARPAASMWGQDFGPRIVVDGEPHVVDFEYPVSDRESKISCRWRSPRRSA